MRGAENYPDAGALKKVNLSNLKDWEASFSRDPLLSMPPKETESAVTREVSTNCCTTMEGGIVMTTVNNVPMSKNIYMIFFLHAGKLNIKIQSLCRSLFYHKVADAVENVEFEEPFIDLQLRSEVVMRNLEENIDKKGTKIPVHT